MRVLSVRLFKAFRKPPIPEIFVTITETTPQSTPDSTPNSNGSTCDVGTSRTQTGGLSSNSGTGTQTSHSTCRVPRPSVTDYNSDEDSDLEGPFLTSALNLSENNTSRSASSSRTSYNTDSTVREASAYDPDAVDIYAQNGITTRDWAYQNQ
ncbi:hypothetical protein O1611_g8627 [Lasiodiplodia mahajangana]|uniref:Uncharacterized protein n=1 Tax=Lasiodiplodia mahajangana TaxID=1108764 RepID=A0ACC2JCB6_9PEZI|nr:hypothetical protein O1611_g8627 [Lasiodiplodia mahajangana]